MSKNFLRTSFLTAALVIGAAGVASAQAGPETSQHVLNISGTASQELTVDQTAVTLTVPLFAAGDSVKTATATSSYSFVTTSVDQAIMVSLDAASDLPTNSNLYVTLQNGSRVEVTKTPTAARSNISTTSGVDETITYELVARPDTPVGAASVTVIYTIEAQ